MMRSAWAATAVAFGLAAQPVYAASPSNEIERTGKFSYPYPFSVADLTGVLAKLIALRAPEITPDRVEAVTGVKMTRSHDPRGQYAELRAGRNWYYNLDVEDIEGRNNLLFSWGGQPPTEEAFFAEPDTRFCVPAAAVEAAIANAGWHPILISSSYYGRVAYHANNSILTLLYTKRERCLVALSINSDPTH
jgi:hypothetical protein